MMLRVVGRALLLLMLGMTAALPAGAVQPGVKHALDPKRTGIPFDHVDFRSTRDAAPLDGWWFEGSPGSPVIVLMPRGKGTMADLLPSVREFSTRGFTVMTFDYRDFGPGSAGESDSLRNIIFASRWVNDGEGALQFARTKSSGRLVFAWGQDLGGPVAVAAAARMKKNADAVVCEGLFRTAQEQLRWNGTSNDPEAIRRHRMLVDGDDEPVSTVGMLQVPLFVVIALKDEVTPPATTRSVARYSLSLIERYTLPIAGHDGAELTPGYFDQISNWLKRIAVIMTPPPAQP